MSRHAEHAATITATGGACAACPAGTTARTITCWRQDHPAGNGKRGPQN